MSSKCCFVNKLNLFLLSFDFYYYREIDVESDDETLYQSKRSSQIKRDQHSSLPDLTESLTDSNNINDISQISDHIEPSSSTSSVSTTAMLSPTSPAKMESKRKGMGNKKQEKER
jgi:hypothetical protein